MNNKVTFVSLETYTPKADCIPFISVSIHRVNTIKSYTSPTPSSVGRIIMVQTKRAIDVFTREDITCQ